jgi:hypothetical protein
MSAEKRVLSRRDFIKAAGAAGLGSGLVPLSSLTAAHASAPTKVTEQMVVPTRPFGKTGVDVSILSLGGVLKDTDQLVFRQAFKSGVTYGTIRLFGFSAHKNMEASMQAAAKLGWVDGIMMSYNYRLMVKDEMKRAVDACARAGIGLTAMKTQATFSANFFASIGSETDDSLKMTENFLKKGYTAEQAKLKVVWENPR